MSFPTSHSDLVDCVVSGRWRIACENALTMNPILIPQTRCQTSKKTPVRVLALAIGTGVLILAGATTSCGTARGFGSDVEKTGDKIQDAASR